MVGCGLCGKELGESKGAQGSLTVHYTRKHRDAEVVIG